MRILHIALDQKFIPFIQSSFETVWPDENRFTILNTKKNGKWKYTHSNENTTVGNSIYFFCGKLKQDLQWCDVLIIHFMTPWSAYAAMQAPLNVPVIWSGWGADYYPLIPGFSDEELVLTETKNALNKAREIEKLIEKKQSIINKTKDFIIDTLFIKDSINRVLSRVDFFSAPIKDDYELLKKAFPQITANYFQISYGSIDPKRIKNIKTVEGNDILVGNSATATNNHIEVFKMLSKIDINGRKVIVPLSYGDIEYRNEVIRIGEILFGNSFIPLVKFMPVEEYNKVISGCSIVIMNHRRQQAVGNIVSAMLSGSKVFLREDNPLFSFFIRNGVHVTAMSEIEENPVDLFSPITKEQFIISNKFIEANWGHKTVLNYIRKLSDLK